MKNTLTTFFSFLLPVFAFTQIDAQWTSYEPNQEHPYGQLNPKAPEQTADFQFLIGQSECKSFQRNQDRTWKEPVDMLWQFKYIMNGTAVQDEVWRGSEWTAGSIRQFQPDSAQWVVSYFSYPSVPYTPGVWHGGKEGDDIVLLQPQKAPNGMDGFSRLTFYDMTPSEFKWTGVWVSEDGSFEYPFWKIECKKRQ